jgi:copper(I)-binding protein
MPMTTIFRLLAALALCGAAAGAPAEPVAISAAWIRATPPGATNAAAYLTIANSGPADRLLGAASPAARELQLHTHVEENGVQHMRQVTDIPLPAGATVTLEPGGLHVMLLGVAAPLKPGDQVPMTLHFAVGPDVELRVPVLDGRTLAQRH